ncbi:hypothetical protein QW71_36545, partial [Paenibacillus sp. IHB B 3415]
MQIPGLTNVISIAVGLNHTLGLKSDGTVWAWGLNSAGQLGVGSTTSSLVPQRVNNLSGIIAVAANGGSSYALKNDGTVWSWGNNYYGQLGDNTTTTRLTPVQVLGVSGVTALAAGDSYTYALTSAGTVWGWGRSNHYKIPGATAETTPKAIVMTGLTDIAGIAAGSGINTGIALKKDGSVVIWGENYWQIVAVNGLSGIRSISGGNSNYAVTANGDVQSWNGAQPPVKVEGLSDVSAVAGGENFAIASKADGSVWTWGSINTSGQLGDGTTIARTTPAPIKENTAPKVTLTYPLGSEGAPEESKVNQPSIRWTQADAALTNFAAYQVQVLN